MATAPTRDMLTAALAISAEAQPEDLVRIAQEIEDRRRRGDVIGTDDAALYVVACAEGARRLGGTPNDLRMAASPASYLRTLLHHMTG